MCWFFNLALLSPLCPKYCIHGCIRLPQYLCMHHQNVKLMIHAVNPSLDYRNCLCDITNQNCMLHHCDSCLMNLLLETSLATFIAKSQSNFFKKQKDTLNQVDCILVLDSAENYSFVIQDCDKVFTGIIHRQPFIPLFCIM